MAAGLARCWVCRRSPGSTPSCLVSEKVQQRRCNIKTVIICIWVLAVLLAIPVVKMSVVSISNQWQFLLYSLLILVLI